MTQLASTDASLSTHAPLSACPAVFVKGIPEWMGAQAQDISLVLGNVGSFEE
jgi:hypothetical protein